MKKHPQKPIRYIVKKFDYHRHELIERCYFNTIFDCCNFRGAFIINTEFKNCIFVNCSFITANIIDCIFINCQIFYSRMNFASIWRTKMIECDFDDVDMYRANIKDTEFKNGSLNLNGCTLLNLSGGNLE